MSGDRDVTAVAAGVPYVVESVNDRAPETLDDFLAGAVITVVAATDTQLVTFQGPGRRDADSVLIYEKDHGGVGKDVRIWRIAIHDGRFEAAQRPTF